MTSSYKNMLFEVALTALNIWILYYLIQLQTSKCECALGMKHRLIRLYLTIMIPLTIVLIGAQIMHSTVVSSAIQRHPGRTVAVYMTFLVVKIAYIATVFLYIRELKDTRCDCSVHNARKALEILNYISMVIAVVLIAGGLYIGPTAFSRIVVHEMSVRFK